MQTAVQGGGPGSNQYGPRGKAKDRYHGLPAPLFRSNDLLRTARAVQAETENNKTGWSKVSLSCYGAPAQIEYNQGAQTIRLLDGKEWAAVWSRRDLMRQMGEALFGLSFRQTESRLWAAWMLFESAVDMSYFGGDSALLDSADAQDVDLIMKRLGVSRPAISILMPPPASSLPAPSVSGAFPSFLWHKTRLYIPPMPEDKGRQRRGLPVALSNISGYSTI